MWPFKKKRTSSSSRALPDDWREILKRCDFQLAREQIADFFASSNREAAAQGVQAIFREEFVVAWHLFSEHPNYQNAVGLIESHPSAAPMMWTFFVLSGPGSPSFVYKSLLREDEANRGS